MKLRIITQKYAVELAIQFPKKINFWAYWIHKDHSQSLDFILERIFWKLKSLKFSLEYL